jgi:glutathione peroxidase
MCRIENLFLIILLVLSAAVLGCEETTSTGTGDPPQNQNAGTGGVQNGSSGTSDSGGAAIASDSGAGGSETGQVTPVAGNTAGAATSGLGAGQGGSAVSPETGGTIANAGTGAAGTDIGQSGSGGEIPDATIPPVQDAGSDADAAVAECLGAHQFTVDTVDTGPKSLCDYQGDVLLIVNIASNCALTHQLGGLAQLQTTYNSQGFNVLGFWNNQFMGQMGTPAEQAQRVAEFGVNFPLFAETMVNNTPFANPPDEHPLYTWIKSESGGANVSWNFEKFLVGRDGSFIIRHPPTTEPAAIAADIEAAL